MATNSLTSWSELTALYTGGKLIWRTGAPSGKVDGQCVTWGEYRTAVLTAQSGTPDAELLTLNEAEVNAVTGFFIRNVSVAQMTVFYVRDSQSGPPVSSAPVTLGPGATLSFPSAGIRSVQADWIDSLGRTHSGVHFPASTAPGNVSLTLDLQGSGDNRSPTFIVQ